MPEGAPPAALPAKTAATSRPRQSHPRPRSRHRWRGRPSFGPGNSIAHNRPLGECGRMQRFRVAPSVDGVARLHCGRRQRLARRHGSVQGPGAVVGQALGRHLPDAAARWRPPPQPGPVRRPGRHGESAVGPHRDGAATVPRATCGGRTSSGVGPACQLHRWRFVLCKLACRWRRADSARRAAWGRRACRPRALATISESVPLPAPRGPVHHARPAIRHAHWHHRCRHTDNVAAVERQRRSRAQVQAVYSRVGGQAPAIRERMRRPALSPISARRWPGALRARRRRTASHRISAGTGYP